MKQNTTEAKKINMFKTIGLTRLFLRDYKQEKVNLPKTNEPKKLFFKSKK